MEFFYAKPTPLHYYQVIAYLSSATVLLPLVMAFIKPKVEWLTLRWLWYFVLNHFLSELVTMSMALNKIRNLEAMLFFSLIEGVLLLMLYSSTIEEISLKRFLKFLTPAYVLGFVGIYFFFDYHLYIPSYTYPFHQIVMLTTIILFFAALMKGMTEIYLTDSPMFWISSGFLFYYSVSIFYFASHDTLFKDFPEASKNGWLIHSASLILLNLFMSIGICKIRKP